MSVVKKITYGMEKRYWLYTFFTPLTMIGEVFLEILIPYLMAVIIDRGITSKDMPYVLKIGSLMVLSAVLSLFFGAIGARLGAVASQGFSHNLRNRLFEKIQTFSFFNLDKFSTASLITRLTTDVTNIQNVYQLLIRICFRAPFMLASGTIMAFFINSRLALIFLIAIPILAIAIALLSSFAYNRFALMLKKYDRMNTVVQENLIAIRVVKAFVRGEFESEKFASCAESVRNAQIRAERIVIRISPLMMLVVYSCIIAVFWLGGKMVVFGSMQAGELISFLTYVSQILMSLMMIGMIFVNLVLSRASLTRICEVLDEVPDIKDDGSISKLKDGSIDFKNVYFSYNNDISKSVLQDISLSIKSGSTVSIIGGTGAGKSSLISLISRLYDVTAGSIQIGNIDIKDYKLKAVREGVSVVLQKNVLFSGTVTENLLWGNPNATKEEVIQACISSDADSFIKNMPNGYDSMLEPGGANLSGGQRQRLCIARALLKRPAILILDDSTSAVDTATEKRIQDALKNMLPDTTKIIIAQRISSVKESDVIFVLDDGKLSDFGSHEELLERSRIYKEVYESQQTMGDADI